VAVSIPLSTTTITVRRLSDPAREKDSSEIVPEDYFPLATGVRAHIYPVSGRGAVVGGSQEVIDFRLTCDPTDLQHTDLVDDASRTYLVVWSVLRQHPALDHVEAGLRTVSGESP
jgi:hypothetical protein